MHLGCPCGRTWRHACVRVRARVEARGLGVAQQGVRPFALCTGRASLRARAMRPCAAAPLAGTYTVSYTLPKRGAYVVDITIDGDHVIGSPFECVAVESELPAAVKWVRPNFCNGAPPTADETVVERLRALWVSQTDALLLGDILTSAWLLRLSLIHI